MEEEFQAARFERLRGDIRFIAWVALFASLVYFPLDHIYLEGSGLHLMWFARGFYVGPVCLFWALAIPRVSSFKMFTQVMPVSMLPFGVIFASAMYLTGTETSILWGGLALAQIGLFAALLYRWPFRVSIVLALSFLVPYSIALYAMRPDFELWSLSSSAVYSVTLLSAALGWRLEVFDRRGFMMEKELAALRESEERLQKERLDWLNNFARFLNHELRNALIGISTSLQLIDSKPENSSRYLERANSATDFIRVILAASASAANLEASLHSDKIEALDISALVLSQIEIYRQNYAVEFEPHIEEGITVKGNWDRIVQALDKLVSNAVEHSSQGATVQVALRAGPNSMCIIEIANSGEPLPDDIERLFEPYVSTNQNASNVGLGLYVARTIARSLGGDLVAEAQTEPCGAIFEIRLPQLKPEDTSA